MPHCWSCRNKYQGCKPPANSWKKKSTAGDNLQPSLLHHSAVGGTGGNGKNQQGLVPVLNRTLNWWHHQRCASGLQLQSSSWMCWSLAGNMHFNTLVKILCTVTNPCLTGIWIFYQCRLLQIDAVWYVFWYQIQDLLSEFNVSLHGRFSSGWNKLRVLTKPTFWN